MFPAVLIILACLDFHCEEFRISVPTYTTCTVFGEIMVLHWERSHPTWEIQRWKCEEPIG